MDPHAMLEVECPSCRMKQDIMVHSVLDVTSDPGLKEQFFTGRINYFTCPSCRFEGFITAPLDYHDTEQKICAKYVPVEYFEDEEYLKRAFLPDGNVRPDPCPDPESAAASSCMQDAHIVFSMTELIRYVLFRDRLDQVFTEQEAK